MNDWRTMARPATYRPVMLDTAGIPTNIPMETPNTKNRREHWRPRADRTAAQRAKTRKAVAKWLEANGPVLRITVTRVAPRRIDQTNLGAALSAVVDGIADALRLDDGSLAVDWVLRQRKGRAAVEWEIGAVT